LIHYDKRFVNYEEYGIPIVIFWQWSDNLFTSFKEKDRVMAICVRYY